MASWAPTENFSWADDVEESIPLSECGAGGSAAKKETERPKEESTKLSWSDAFLKTAGSSSANTTSEAPELDLTESAAMEEDQSGERSSRQELSSPADDGSIASASPLEADLGANGETDASEAASTGRQSNEEVGTSPMEFPSDDEELSSSSSALSQICEDAWGKDTEIFGTVDPQSHEKDFVASLTEKLLHAPRGKDVAENVREEDQSDGKDEEHNTRLSGSTIPLPANEGQRADAIGQGGEMENKNPRWKVWVVLYLFALCYCCLCTKLGMLCHPA